MPYKISPQLARLLIEGGFVTSEKYKEIEAAAKESGKDIEAVLIRQKIIDEEKLTELKGKVLNVPYINLVGTEIEDKVLDIIPESVARNYEMISFAKEDNKIKIGMLNPKDFKALEALEFLAKESGFDTEIYIISRTSYEDAVKRYENLGEEVEEVLSAAEKKFVKPEGAEKTLEMEEVLKRAPISKIVSSVIKHAVEAGASDIHIEPEEKESKIRYRIDGILRISLVLPKYVHAALISRIKVMANLKIDETRIPQDGRIRYVFDSKVVDLRVSTLPLLGQEKVVMRILDISKKAPTLEQLGYLEEHRKVIEDNIKRPHGMFLISGPTGSGKSTTLYSILSMLNTEGVNIVTLEDPIEYFLPGVNQSQVNYEVNYTFSSGLRSILRQDPDIVMVGEIRDSETAELSVHAALTGHLLFSTIHTNNAFGVVPRLIDMKVEAFLLASTMNVAIAQRLVRKICEHCKEEIKIPADIMKKIQKEIDIMPKTMVDKYLNTNDIGKIKFYRGKGCAYCGNTGYSGRLAIAEILSATNNLKDIIVTGFNSKKVFEEAKRQGMVSLKQDGIIKAAQGITTIEEVLRVSNE